MQFFIITLIVGIILYLLLAPRKGDKDIVSHWYYHFEDLQTSAKDFYASIEAALTESQMPDLSISREWFSEAGITSSEREYLRVHRGDNSFYICAAPDGKRFFVSCWAKFKQPMADFWESVPFGSGIARRLRQRTMFQQDTQILFNENLKIVVGKAVDTLAETKGLRSTAIHDKAYE